MQHFLAGVDMHDKVFSPLGMQDTLADESDKIIPNRARWYTIMGDGTYRNTPYEDLSYKWAGGGFLSQAEDLARFGAALLKPGILKTRHSRDDLLASGNQRWQEDEVRPRLVYSRYWRRRSRAAIRSQGGVAGSSSWLVIYPDQGVVIAWVQNSNEFRDWPIANVSAPFFSQGK
jgi:serine beta-lactamase-like protein LACTB, mitochondrial